MLFKVFEYTTGATYSVGSNTLQIKWNIIGIWGEKKREEKKKVDSLEIV